MRFALKEMLHKTILPHTIHFKISSIQYLLCYIFSRLNKYQSENKPRMHYVGDACALIIIPFW